MTALLRAIRLDQGCRPRLDYRGVYGPGAAGTTVYAHK